MIILSERLLLVAPANSVRANNNNLLSKVHRVLHNDTYDFFFFLQHSSISFKIFAAPIESVFCACYIFMSTPTAASYFAKSVDVASNAPSTTGITVTFFMPHVLAISSLNISQSFAFLLCSPAYISRFDTCDFELII